MGQSQELSQKNQDLLKKLNFIQNQQSPHYGQLQVFRICEKPFDYYLRYRQVYQRSEQSQNLIKENKQLYERLDSHRNVVRVQIFHPEKSILLCSDAVTVNCYAKYYNYTLSNAINSKRSYKRMFTDADLLYVFTSLVDIASRISELTSDLYFGLFQADKVFLSTQGFLKVYPFRLNRLATISQLSNSETSSTSTSPFNKHSSSSVCNSDLKDIAQLMTQLILLEHQKDLDPLSREHVQFRLDKTVAGKVSPRIRYLVIRLLKGEELSWSSLKKELQGVQINEGTRPAYCIRLDEDISLRESQVLQREEKEMAYQKVERHSMLSSIQPNLVVSRIEPLSRQKQF